jgi:hypothetical protein
LVVAGVLRLGVVVRGRKRRIVREEAGSKRTRGVSFRISRWTVRTSRGVENLVGVRTMIVGAYRMGRRVRLGRRRRVEEGHGKGRRCMRSTVHRVFLVPKAVDIEYPIVLRGGLEEVETPMVEIVGWVGVPTDFVVGVALGLPML